MTSWARWRIKSPASPVFAQTVCSGADQRKHKSSASLAFVRGIHRWPVDSPDEGPVTRKMFPLDGVIMKYNMGYCNTLSGFDANRFEISKLISSSKLQTGFVVKIDYRQISNIWLHSFIRSFLTKYRVKYFVQILKYHTKRLKFQVLKHKNSDGSLFISMMYYVLCIRRTKYQKSNVSNFVLQLSLCNVLDSGVKSRMKM